MQLPIRPISAAALAPHGWPANAGAAAGRPNNEGSSQRLGGVGELPTMVGRVSLI